MQKINVTNGAVDSSPLSADNEVHPVPLCGRGLCDVVRPWSRRIVPLESSQPRGDFTIRWRTSHIPSRAAADRASIPATAPGKSTSWLPNCFAVSRNARSNPSSANALADDTTNRCAVRSALSPHSSTASLLAASRMTSGATAIRSDGLAITAVPPETSGVNDLGRG